MYVTREDLDSLKIVEMKGLRPKVWERLDEIQKVTVLQECERRISQREGRPEATVQQYDFTKDPIESRHTWDAAYDAPKNTIKISPQVLAKDVYKAFGEYAHEARHAYQYRAVQVEGFHRNLFEVEEWKKALPSYNPESSRHLENDAQYKWNPLESDAHIHRLSLTQKLREEHQIQRAQAQLKRELMERHKDERER